MNDHDATVAANALLGLARLWDEETAIGQRMVDVELVSQWLHSHAHDAGAEE
jgi:hypothetical protein